MPKVGHAFSDYILEGKAVKTRNAFSSSLDITSFFPLFVLFTICAVLVLRLVYLQLLRGEYYKLLSNENRTRTKIISAPRGIIFDRNSKPLVRNSPAFKIIEGKKVIWMNKDEALKLKAEGKDIAIDVMRDYLYKDVFAHVVGYVGQLSKDEITLPKFKDYSPIDIVGKLGLEKQYEALLHGENGRELYEIDARGKMIRALGKEEEQAGKDLKTTLDVDIQTAAADGMRDVSRGAVVVSDPRDGGIYALYSKPSFDPNIFTHPKNYKGVGKYKKIQDVLTDLEENPFLDRGIGGTYPPGSTFKLVTAVAALEKGAMSASTVVEDTGILKVGEFSFGNWYYLQYGKTDGAVNMVKAIKRSNDIYFYKAAEQAGVDAISNWARKFNLGEKLGIDLPGEAKGTVPDVSWKKEVTGEPWYLGDTYHLGIGQGFLLTTPLQVNFWTIPFANGGYLFKPYLVKGTGKLLKKNFIKRENINLIREGMRQSCEVGGVAWPFFDFKVKNSRLKVDGKDYTEDASAGAKMVRVHVGCKTGTAETTKEKNPHAWITVFAPFYNPEIVVTVLVENGGEGSSVAGPIAKQILTKYFEKK